jgi:hypothetical protein
MTSNAPGSHRILGSLRSAGGKGVVRMQDRFDTDIDDGACLGARLAMTSWRPASAKHRPPPG